MTLDRSFIERNRASTQRIRAMVARLSDEELGHPVGELWTVSIVLAHLAFSDLRVMNLLDACRDRDVKLYQASTSEMFGSTPPPQREDTPFQPRSPYSNGNEMRPSQPLSPFPEPLSDHGAISYLPTLDGLRGVAILLVL